MGDTNDVQLSVRMPRRTADRITDLAAHHGRTRSEELRIALALHDAQSSLAHLNLMERSGAIPADVASRKRTRIQKGLRRLREEAFGPRPALLIPDDLEGALTG